MHPEIFVSLGNILQPLGCKILTKSLTSFVVRRYVDVLRSIVKVIVTDMVYIECQIFDGLA